MKTRWARAGERLRKLDPARFERVLAMAEAIVGVHEGEDEDTHQARMRRASGTVLS